jgi:hypothetical protein
MYGRRSKMSKTKITVRVDADAYAAARRFAERKGVTVTDLVTQFFRSLEKEAKAASRTPILEELAGTLRPDTRIEDYDEHLERKYSGDA